MQYELSERNSLDRHAALSDNASPSRPSGALSPSLGIQRYHIETALEDRVIRHGVSKNRLGGRPSSLQRLGIAREDIWNLAAQGLTNVQVAKRLTNSKGRISVRTVAKYLSEMPPDYRVRLDDFDAMPEVEELRNWINSRYSTANNADNIISRLKRIWEACWRKPLESVDENDIVKAVAWIREKQPDGQFDWILSIRYMIRSGIGQPYWLTKHLGTRGKKRPPRTLAILNSPDFFDKTLPLIYSEIDKLTYLSQRQRNELRLVLMLKATTGIRTGAMIRRRKLLELELWGTRLGEGKTNLQIINCQFVDWIVRAKKNETWHIKYMPPKVMRLLLSHVAKYRIGQGEPLIQELKTVQALKALKCICRNLALPNLVLHDFRKVYLTGLCLSGIPLETAVDLNVGWKDLNTARNHYLAVKAMNADQQYEKFQRRFFK